MILALLKLLHQSLIVDGPALSKEKAANQPALLVLYIFARKTTEYRSDMCIRIVKESHICVVK
jgi:hypothetical protein